MSTVTASVIAFLFGLCSGFLVAVCLVIARGSAAVREDERRTARHGRP